MLINQKLQVLSGKRTHRERQPRVFYNLVLFPRAYCENCGRSRFRKKVCDVKNRRKIALAFHIHTHGEKFENWSAHSSLGGACSPNRTSHTNKTHTIWKPTKIPTFLRIFYLCTSKTVATTWDWTFFFQNITETLKLEWGLEGGIFNFFPQISPNVNCDPDQTVKGIETPFSGRESYTSRASYKLPSKFLLQSMAE